MKSVSVWAIMVLKGSKSLWLLLIVLVSLLACAPFPQPVEDEPSIGQTRKSAIVQQQKLIAEVQGWRVWKIADKQHTFCFALKPAENTAWPQFSREYGTWYGGAGFYMTVADHVETPYFGFYGQHPYRLPATAQVNETSVTAIDDRESVLSWQGKSVGFYVPTQPSPEAYSERHEARGTVDFTGVEAAYERLMRCHRRIAR